MQMAKLKKYYHGGAPGLAAGGLIRPADEAKTWSSTDRSQRVFITDNILFAIMYAAMHPSRKGIVYEVEPIGEVMPEKEPGRFAEFTCDCAKILKKAEVPEVAIETARRAQEDYANSKIKLQRKPTK
jgi:rifampin ADP-ribosylating transferase